MIDFQVTLGSGATPLIAAGQPNQYASWMVIYNNAGHQVNVGGSGVTSSRGIPLLNNGGSVTGEFNFPRGCCLNNVYLIGTSSDVINITYEPSM